MERGVPHCAASPDARLRRRQPGLPKLYAISHEVPPECQGETRTNQWPRDRYISAVVPRRTVDWDTP
jgi:hypothetical protein